MNYLNIDAEQEDNPFSGRTKSSVTKSLKYFLKNNKKLNQSQYDSLLLKREFIKNKKATNIIFEHIYENKNNYIFDDFLTQLISLYRNKDPEYFFSILKKIDIESITPKIGLILINNEIKDLEEFQEDLTTSLSFFKRYHSVSFKENKEIENNISKSIGFYFHSKFKYHPLNEQGLFLFNQFIEFYKNIIGHTFNVNSIISSISKENLAVLESLYLQKSLLDTENSLPNGDNRMKKRI